MKLVNVARFMNPGDLYRLYEKPFGRRSCFENDISQCLTLARALKTQIDEQKCKRMKATRCV